MLTQSNLSPCEQVTSPCPTLAQSGEEPVVLPSQPGEYPQNNLSERPKTAISTLRYKVMLLALLGAAFFCLIQSEIIQVTWIKILSFCSFINHHPAYVIFGAIVIGMIAGACWYMIYDAAHELDADIAAENKNRWRLVDDKFADCQRCAHRVQNHEGRGHTCPHSSMTTMDDIAGAYQKQFGKNFFALQLEARSNRSYIWSEELPPPLALPRKAKTHYLKQARAENVWLRYRLGKCRECWHYWNCTQPGPKNEPPLNIRLSTKRDLEERAHVLKTRPIDRVPVDRQTKRYIRLIEQKDPENPMLSDVVSPPSDEELEQRRIARHEADRRAEIAAFEQKALSEGRYVSAPRQDLAEYMACEISNGFRKNPSDDQAKSTSVAAQEESGPPIALSTAKPQAEPEKRGRGRPRKYPKDSRPA